MSTDIEWAQETWNPTLGCSRVSPGCDGCYAIRQANMRASNPNPSVAAAFADLVVRDRDRLDWTGVVRFLPERLGTPLRWRTPRRIFVDSMSDLFHEVRMENEDALDRVRADEVVARVWAVMALTPQHTYQLLTKRHGRMRSLLTSSRWPGLVRDALVWVLGNVSAAMPAERVDAAFRWAESTETPDEVLAPLPNVWLGVSVEDQKRADLRIPALLATPAAVRWLSCEPLLGPLDLSGGPIRGIGADRDRPRGATLLGSCGSAGGSCGDNSCRTSIDWVVVGGETGPGARPMHPDWARSLRAQCTAGGVPFFFKQWGDWGPAPWSVPVDPNTDGDLFAAAKRDAEAIGATHALNGAGHLYEPPYRPWSLERTGLPTGTAGVRRHGKKAAGRALDGELWDQYPTSSHA